MTIFKNFRRQNWIFKMIGAALVAGWLGAGVVSSPAATIKLLNVSYDVTREFYQDYNGAFADYWRKQTGDTAVISVSNGGSSKQVHSVIDGLEADVVTMNQPLDVDLLHTAADLLPADWATRLPNHSVPYTSTILFMVRKGNPRHIKDWDDLVQPGVAVVIPNPKTSGNGRYSYLAAWGYALRQAGGGTAAARKFLATLFANVPVLDTGGRGATTTFAVRGVGDALLTFESETALMQKQFPADQFEVVVPSMSILAENPVAWVDHFTHKHGTQKAARAYLEYLYSDAAQEIAAAHYFRPVNPGVLAKYPDRFKPLKLFTVNEVFGSWQQAQQTHFAEGGFFDQIYQPK